MKNRQLVYIPQIEPNTFLFFYFRGDTDRSYSLRNYMVAEGPPQAVYANAFPDYSASDILKMAQWHFDAEAVRTDDVRYWRAQIKSLNQRYLHSRENLKAGSEAAADFENADDHARPPQAQPSVRQTQKPDNVILILGAGGQSIHSVDDWLLYAPPKMGERHWKDGRRAKELAKALFTTGAPVVPPELLDLLASSVELGEVRFTEAWPERKIQLDSYFGETRNADLAAIAIGECGKIAVTVEAKADESFGKPIAEELSGAASASKVPARIAALCSSVLGRAPASVGALRYQLLHGIAGTLIFAKEQKAAAAVFIVYEFNSPSCSSQNRERNAGDLASFLSVLSSSRSPIEAGKIAGPFFVPGDARVSSSIPLFVGKAIRYIA